MFIKSYCRITNHSIVLDGQRQETLGKFLNGHHVSEDLDNVFEQLDADYPAFFGMDEFSKLGFITAELLMRHNGYDTETFKPDIGVVIHSRSGTLGADYHLLRVMDGLSDDTQAYKRTIPNAICADIACRFKLGGEMGLILADGFVYEHFFRTSYGMFSTDPDLKTLLSGYVECYGGYMSALLCLLERSQQPVEKDYDLMEERFCIDLLRIH
ncbi:MAG: hypothetical protein GX281_02165 [Bacteroidales bacterium]|jgi:hypothetical protein|nr:hypothetical protein [Bacteroidales bacterium]NLK79516.1 hypothetical protein [Bacteroidales bacterium]HKM31584.1 hypothetical protein [Bacteroidales bacterium]HPX79697.1 hypothetical protein [Bacteroidales bacterium]